MIAISYASPLHYLVLIDEAYLLHALYGVVVVPPAVIAELSHEGTPAKVRDWILTSPPWFEIANADRRQTSGLQADYVVSIRSA